MPLAHSKQDPKAPDDCPPVLRRACTRRCTHGRSRRRTRARMAPTVSPWRSAKSLWTLRLPRSCEPRRRSRSNGFEVICGWGRRSIRLLLAAAVATHLALVVHPYWIHFDARREGAWTIRLVAQRGFDLNVAQGEQPDRLVLRRFAPLRALCCLPGDGHGDVRSTTQEALLLGSSRC